MAQTVEAALRGWLILDDEPAPSSLRHHLFDSIYAKLEEGNRLRDPVAFLDCIVALNEAVELLHSSDPGIHLAVLPGTELRVLPVGQPNTMLLLRKSDAQPDTISKLTRVIWTSHAARALHVRYLARTFGPCVNMDPMFICENLVCLVLSVSSALLRVTFTGVDTRQAPTCATLDRWL